jgi:hypothetical protein
VVTRIRTLRAGFLLLSALSLVSFGAVAQSATPAPPPDASSDDDATALAKKLQNPIGDLYSFPFQNNTNFNTGPHKGTQRSFQSTSMRIGTHHAHDPATDLATVVAAGANRTVRHRPEFSAFLSPKNPTNGWLWAIGPVFQFPTISDKSLGSNIWGGGPTAALVWST